MAVQRVLIVDDSAAVRQALSEVVNSDPGLDVMGVATHPLQAVEKIRKERPDVILLDVEMPHMDGVTFLRRIMNQHPIPVVMCSTLMEENSRPLLDALEAGAVDVIQKPRLGATDFFEENRARICSVLRAAATARPRAATTRCEKRYTADEVLPPPIGRKTHKKTGHLIAIGASTGGTEALSVVLRSLPVSVAPIVIVQHMPAAFTGAFAQRLNQSCAITVKEAQHGDTLQTGCALIAPGGIHMLVSRSSRNYFVELRDGPSVARHKPSVDVLFRSVARVAGANATGVILTGMGDDGARGLRELRDAGGETFGQDEASSVVYGMPKAAFETGAVKTQLPLSKVGARLVKV